MHCNKRPLDEMGPPHKRPPDEMGPPYKRPRDEKEPTDEMEPPCKRPLDQIEHQIGDFCSDCKGVRVFYYKEGGMTNTNDHEHKSIWEEEVTRITEEKKQACLEAGVVVNCWRAVEGSDLLVEVMWDCGVSKTYSNAAGEWDNIRILDMGPAGN